MSKNRVVKSHRKFTEENIIDIDTAQKHFRPKKIELIPRTRNQEKLVMALADHKQHVVVTTGPAGTGKTYLCMLAAVKALSEKKCDRIVLTRPAVGVDDEQHGFLPGNLVAKMEPWTRPLIDVLREYYRPQEIENMIENQIIEISPLAFMRGRTFKKSWIIFDEAQNATPSQVMMCLTRIGEGSKIVVTGDQAQSDRRNNFNGLMDLCLRLEKNPISEISVCEMTGNDIQRHPVIGKILNIYEE